jgi:hypothetical protein
MFDKGISCSVKFIVSKVQYADTRVYVSNVHHYYVICRMIWINAVGWTLVVFLTVYAGMLIFARYYDCDPLSSGVSSNYFL